MSIRSESSRREFIQRSTTAMGVLAATSTLDANLLAADAPPRPQPKAPAAPPRKLRSETSLAQTGWNLHSARFVFAPTWTWAPLAGAAAYVVQIAHAADDHARTIRLDSPTYDMAPDWNSLDVGCIDMLAYAVDASDKPICTAWRKRFWKSPPFDGVVQEPADWEASIHRAMAHLVAPARDKVEDFERGLPRSLWSCCEDSLSGQRRLLGFPALHHPSFIFAFLAYAAEFPQSEHSAIAVDQARTYADWLLANRQPVEFRCSLFPFSTIEMGRTHGYIEGSNVTLFRAARVGEAMIAMHRHTDDEKYLEYARHLANVYVSLQRPDGSWPHRVDPKTGAMVEDYTSNAVSPARLFALLEAIEPNPRYAAARDKAIRWVLDNPVKTKRWQGMYEDVGQSIPFRNLQHWDVNEFIGYLVHFHQADPQMVQVAANLNRYIEDQFVIWQEGDGTVAIRCPTPTVTEQYTCNYPMECHTAIWIGSLIALHRATGEAEYLTKATNAANSIVRAQQECGAYSTWGYDVRFQRPFISVEWPGCNAIAVHRLLQLRSYVQNQPDAQRLPHPV